MKCPTSIIEDNTANYNVAESNIQFINSRFGTLRINTNKTIFFPNGLPGISENKFCLAHLPQEKFKPFKVLQSINNHELALIVYPLSSGELIDQQDLLMCAKLLETSLESMIICLIASISRTPNFKITVNARAPVIININKNIAIQHIFNHDKYEIKHEIFIL